MNSITMLFISLSILISGVTFISTNNIISTLIVLLISILYFFLIAYKHVKKYIISSHRFHSCYTFINSFLVSLSIKGSLVAAFEYVKLNMDKEYNTIVDGISHLKEDEKLDYLKDYFDFDIYQLFLSVISIYIEQGGDILTLSNYLINEARRSEDYLIKSEGSGKRKIIDFGVLWLFTLVILIILRFALSQFYGLISSLLFYQISIVVLALIILLSIHLLIIRFTNLDIKGFKYDK